MPRKVEFVIKRTVPDYYKVLDVAPSANIHQIKQHYYQLVELWHPDRVGDNDRMPAITEAYGVLSNKQRRAAYDARRKLLYRPCATCKGAGVTYKQKGFTQRVSIPCDACKGTGIKESHVDVELSGNSRTPSARRRY